MLCFGLVSSSTFLLRQGLPDRSLSKPINRRERRPGVRVCILARSAGFENMGDRLPVLVTGATGFLGSHLCPALSKTGYQVFTLSRRPDPSKTENHKSSTHFACDLTKDSEKLASILKSQQWHAVIHLAGLISYTATDNEAMKAINVGATRQLVDETIHSCPTAKFVYCSSVAAVGSNTLASDPPLTESASWDASMNSIGYPYTKKVAEDAVLQAGRGGRLKTIAFCPSNIYGRGDAAKASRKTQIRAANGKARLYTHGGVSIVHVDVVVDAFVKAVRSDGSDAIWRGTRWLLTGDNVTVWDMLKMCAEEGNNPETLPWLCPPFWLLFVVCWIAQLFGSRSLTVDRVTLASRFHWYDGSKARHRFDLKYVSARDAIADSVQWMREQRIVTSHS